MLTRPGQCRAYISGIFDSLARWRPVAQVHASRCHVLRCPSRGGHRGSEYPLDGVLSHLRMKSADAPRT